MSLLEKLTSWFRIEPVDSLQALEDFVDSRSAFLAQKCIYEYSRARSGINFQKLFKEQEFQDAILRSTWTCYPITCAFVCEMIEGQLRPFADSDTVPIVGGLNALALRVFDRHPLPPGAPPTFWNDAIASVEQHLAKAQLHAPKPVRDIPMERVREIYDNLPIHPNLTGHDYELIQNNIRTNFVQIYVEFEKSADCRRLAADLAQFAESAA